MPQSPLRIDSAELRIVRLPLLSPFTTSTGTMHEKVFPLLTLRAGGIEGHAEGVMDPLPDFLDETIPATVAFLRDAVMPHVVGKAFANPEEINRPLRPWRGHWMAKAMVDMAFWDLWARSLGLPLGTLLGGSGTAVAVGISLGIDDIAATVEKARRHHAEGYRRIKLKIMPGHDLALVRAVGRDPAAPVIGCADIGWAWALSEHCASTLLREADRFLADNEAEAKHKKALNVIRAAGEAGITRTTLMERTHFLGERRDAVFHALIESGQVAAERVEGRTKPTIVYRYIPPSRSVISLGSGNLGGVSA